MRETNQQKKNVDFTKFLIKTIKTMDFFFFWTWNQFEKLMSRNFWKRTIIRVKFRNFRTVCFICTWKIPSPLATGIDFPKAKNKACNFFVKQMSCAAIAHLISRLFVRCFTFRMPEIDVNTFRNDVNQVQGVPMKSF